MATLLDKKQTHFVLWRPGIQDFVPELLIGKQGIPLGQFKEFPLQRDAQFPELWLIDTASCNLEEGTVYYYWFKVHNTEPYDPANRNQVLYCTDPIAYGIDRRVRAPLPANVPDGLTAVTDSDPASVILFRNQKLIPCDPDGGEPQWAGDVPPAHLPANNTLVIYELPTRWTRITSRNTLDIGNGTFEDVLALLSEEQAAPTFPTVAALNNRAHLIELGINALELTPPADSEQTDNWGYGTANFFAADFELGFPAGSPGGPRPGALLTELIRCCHLKGIRFFKDAVMAFSSGTSLRNINFLDFFIKFNSGDSEQGSRDGFGGDLFKYGYQVNGYNPLNNGTDNFYPSRVFLHLYLSHWMHYYRIDGLRLDSVNNVRNYDFLSEVTQATHQIWKERGGNDGNFLVIGESIGLEWPMVQSERVDSFWNEKFKEHVKPAVVGRAPEGISFEQSVREMIDCRLLGFKDGSQVINYITSHDMAGVGSERLYQFLEFNNVDQKEERFKLAFVCLLTAVGIPMILAGEEFADEMDIDIFDAQGNKDDEKQIDPVNYSRFDDEWRKQVFYCVARLVKLRTNSAALSVNDTEFIHVDFNEGKRVLVWKRGRGSDIVVVVANFSNWGTDRNGINAEYVVPNWPALPAGRQWREITQERDVPGEWAGREPLFPFEAKVYAAL